MVKERPNGLHRDVKLIDRRVSVIEKFIVAQHEFNAAQAEMNKEVRADTAEIKEKLDGLQDDKTKRVGGDEALAKMVNKVVGTIKVATLILSLIGIVFGAAVYFIHHF
jgi:hypothetical protein